MKKACTLILFALLVQLCYGQGDSARVRQYNTGQAFTSITLDPVGNVWAGTRNAGLWKLNRDSIGETPTPLSLYTSQGLTNYTIQTLTANNQGGQIRVWAGVKGTGSSSVGGGIYVYNDGNTTPKILRNERNKYIARKMNLIPVKFDGTPSRNPIALASDPNGGIWAAHGYHDLTVSSTGITIIDPVTGFPFYQDKAGYYLTPGGLGYKAPNQNVFDNLSMLHMPYPAYTINTPLDKTAGTRQCVSVGCGQDETWMGFGTYEVDVEESGGGTRFSGIARFSLTGAPLGYIDASNTPELPFTNTFASPRAITIHWQKTGDPWIGFNGNKGFAVHKNHVYSNAQWVYVDKLLYYDTASGANLPSRLLPNGIRINSDAPHAISSAGQRVFIGTMDGLLVYKGEGDLKQDSSYILITTANGLSSNNIKGVAASSRYIYAATDDGINEIFLPSDLIVFHVKDKDNPNKEDNNNYETIAALTSRNNLNIRFNENDLPMMAADGTTSTVFRYYTADFEGFYSNKYQFGFGGDYENRDTNRYGSFHLKPKNLYTEENPGYVDFIYRHPTYIATFDPEKSGQDLLFTISKRGVIGNFDFRHNMRIVLPPVMMVHGIWSSIQSFKVMENKFLESKQYKPFQIQRIFHENPVHPEPRFWAPEQIYKIPEGIDKLLSNCSTNGLSAGRVDVLGHSRGGMMTRLYIQSQGAPYRDDVNKLITFNTPHAGSQQANWVCDPRVITVYRRALLNLPITLAADSLKWYAIRFGLIGNEYEHDNGRIEVYNDDVNGAWQLRVNDPMVEEILNGDSRLNDTIFKHAIQTVHRFKWSFLDLNDEGLSSSKKFNALRRAVMLYNPALFYSAATGAGVGIDLFLKHLFDGEYSDVIVPVSSQRGGLSSPYYTDMSELYPGRSIAHSNSAGASVVEDSYVMERALEILMEPTTYLYQTSSSSPSFTKDAFFKDDNTPLKYTFLPFVPGNNGTDNNNARKSSKRLDTQDNTSENSFILIDPSQRDLSKNIGDTITYTVTYGKNVKYLLMFYEGVNSNSSYSEYKAADSVNLETTFTFPVPKEELNQFLVTAYGYSNLTLISKDTTLLHVNKSATLKADSIIIVGPEKFLNLKNGEQEKYKVFGYFNDGITRDITYSNDISYLKRNADIIEVDQKGIIKGIKEGLTSFIVKYDNQFDSILVNVIKNTTVAQTYLFNFKGDLNKLTSEVNLSWETFQEYKTKLFSVERSNNGISFDSIGFVKAGGTQVEGAQYNFSTPAFSGKNMYYRLKLIDSTGKATYSNKIKIAQDPVVSSINPNTTESKSGLTIFPNPVSSGKIDMEFNSKSKDSHGVLTITDLNGIKVFERKVSVENGFNKMNISIPSSIIPGIYIVDIKAQNNNYRSKLVIAY